MTTREIEQWLVIVLVGIAIAVIALLIDKHEHKGGGSHGE